MNNINKINKKDLQREYYKQGQLEDRIEALDEEVKELENLLAEKENSKYASEGVRAFTFLSLMFFGYILTIASVIYIGATSDNLQLSEVYQKSFIFQFLFYLIMPLVIYFYIFRKTLKPKKTLMLNKLSTSNMVLIICMHTLVMPVLYFINYVSLMFFDDVIGETIKEMNFNYLMLFLLVGIIGPVLEELIFRGVFFDLLKKKNPVVIALVTGVVFGAYHMNWNQFIYATFLGVIFALYVAYTGSIWSSIVPHILVNSFSVSIMVLFDKYADEINVQQSEVLSKSEFTIFAIVALGCFIAFAVTFNLFRKYNITHNKKCLYYKGE